MNLPELLDADLCIAQLIMASGNRDLAAERLGTTVSILTASIANDSSATDMLARQSRVVMLLDTMDLLQKTAITLQAAMATDMEAKDVVKAYQAMTTLVAQLTDSKTSTTNVNVTEVVMRMLPPRARQAVFTLIENGQIDRDAAGVGDAGFGSDADADADEDDDLSPIPLGGYSGSRLQASQR